MLVGLVTHVQSPGLYHGGTEFTEKPLVAPVLCIVRHGGLGGTEGIKGVPDTNFLENKNQ